MFPENKMNSTCLMMQHINTSYDIILGISVFRKKNKTKHTQLRIHLTSTIFPIISPFLLYHFMAVTPVQRRVGRISQTLPGGKIWHWVVQQQLRS